jgi:hypothetical protein
MNEIDLYLSVNQKQVGLCKVCGSDDLLVCCEELPAENNAVPRTKGMTHAFAIEADIPSGWVVTGPLDTVAFHETGPDQYVTRALDWLERTTGNHRTRDLDTMTELVQAIEQSEVAFGVCDVTASDLDAGLPEFDHYCCTCQQTVPIRFKVIDGDYGAPMV